MSTELTVPAGLSALIVAHPGHELRVHGWLEQAKPVVFVLTDGSGGSSASRLPSSRRLITAVGATAGPIFGRLTDRQLYEAALNRRFSVFTELVDELAAALLDRKIDVVVADAEEGYNSGHDICRGIVDAAVTVAEHFAGRPIASFDFLLVGRPDAHDGRPHTMLRLDDSALQRKLEAARRYPEMASEVDAALQRFGADAFRIECLRVVAPAHTGRPRGAEVPFYERFGEQQVAAGLYTDVIRAREHVYPLVDALRQHALGRTTCSRSSSC